MRQGDFSEGEDGLKIILDPFNNGRSGYVFQLTPNGIRGDGLFRNVTDINWDWEAIWDASARIHDTGWTAEIAIPFKTLSFNPSNTTWGINFTRTIGRRKEDIGWVSYNRSQNPANSGKLVGLTGMEQGLGLDVVVGAAPDAHATGDALVLVHARPALSVDAPGEDAVALRASLALRAIHKNYIVRNRLND